MGIRQFTKYGYACLDQARAIETGYNVIFELKGQGQSANKKSANVPDDCFLESIEFELSLIAASDTITMFLARDSAGKNPITSDALSGATQTVTLSAGASTTGGVIFTIGKDYHFDTTTTNATSGSLYLAVKANAACQADQIRLNWRS
tara:strand:- start:158 stop:601 length:444 start_codon:yes stop_codon:yes gene_type:complete